MKTIQELLSIANEKGVKSSYLNTLINGYRGKIAFITARTKNMNALAMNAIVLLNVLGNKKRGR